MKNIQIERKGDLLTVKIDLSKTSGASKSGKSIVIASTEGNVAIEGGMFLGINCYKKA